MALYTRTYSVLTIGTLCSLVLSCSQVAWPLGSLSYTWNLRFKDRDKREWASPYVPPCVFSKKPFQNSGGSFQSVELIPLRQTKQQKKRVQWGNLLQNSGCFLQFVELITFRPKKIKE